MRGLRLPLIAELRDCRRVLVAGAGGGLDVYSGLPLYFALRDEGKDAYLASMSFSNLDAADGRRLTETLLEVSADSGGSETYFPERFLCEWFRQQGEEASVYSFKPSGVQPTTRGSVRSPSTCIWTRWCWSTVARTA